MRLGCLIRKCLANSFTLCYVSFNGHLNSHPFFYLLALPSVSVRLDAIRFCSCVSVANLRLSLTYSIDVQVFCVLNYNA